jgi:hypothetical protein
VTGEYCRPAPAIRRRSVLVVGEAGAEPAHGEGGADDDGVAEVLAARGTSSMVWQMTERADSAPQRSTTPLNFSRSSPSWIASTLAPMSGQSYFSRTRARAGHRAVQRGLAAEGGQDGVGALLGDDLLDDLGVIGST